MAVGDGQDAEEVIRAAVLGWRDGLAVLRRLAERSAIDRVPMKLDF